MGSSITYVCPEGKMGGPAKRVLDSMGREGRGSAVSVRTSYFFLQIFYKIE